jgi:hypothetical protein
VVVSEPLDKGPLEKETGTIILTLIKEIGCEEMNSTELTRHFVQWH